MASISTFIQFKTMKGVLIFLSIFTLRVISNKQGLEPHESDLIIETTLQNDSSNAFITDNKGFGYSYSSTTKTVRCHSASYPRIARTLYDLQTIVKQAVIFKLNVKAVGSLHSATDCICTTGVTINMTNIKHFSFDPKTNYATAGAGLQLGDFQEFLARHGRSLTSSPVYGGVTIAGAIGTGAHGSSLEYPATLSDQIVSMTYVDGLGEVWKITEGEADFKAYRVHLGLLGIIYEAVFKTVPQYKLQITNSLLNDSILFDNNGRDFMKLINDNPNNLIFAWFPTNNKLLSSTAIKLPANASGNCESHLTTEADPKTLKELGLYLELLQAVGDDLDYFVMQSLTLLAFAGRAPAAASKPLFTEEDGVKSCLPVAVGYGYKLQTNKCKQCTWDVDGYGLDEFEISIPLEELPAAVKTFRDIFNKQLTLFPLGGIYFRFIRRMDAYLGYSNGGDRVAIEWGTVPRYDRSQPRLGVTAFQAMAQALIAKHRGRSHFGKNGLYFTDGYILRRAFPDLDKFIDVMIKVDPKEVFMNNLGRRIKYGSDKATASVAMGLRCALNEVCVCKDDLDCGNGGPTDYECRRFMDYRVCKRRPNPFEDIKDIASRLAVEKAAKLLNRFF